MSAPTLQVAASAAPASRRRCRGGRSLDLDPAEAPPAPAPEENPRSHSVPTHVEFFRDTLIPSRALDRSYLHPGLRASPGKPGSIPAQSGQPRTQSRRTASRVSTPSRPLRRARQSGQAQVLAWEGGARVQSQCALSLHPSKRTNLSLVLPYRAGPFPVLKTVTAPGPGAGGSRPLRGRQN